MKKKITAFVLCTVLLFCALNISAAAYSEDDTVLDFALGLRESDSIESQKLTRWFYNSGDGLYYIFLPGAADRGALKVWFRATGLVYCGSTQLRSGGVTAAFSSGDRFEISCDGKTYPVAIMQGTGIASVFISTESGSLENVHADKEYKEPGDITVVSGDGTVQYDGALEYIKGRGNSTWNLDKKPYNIKLDKKADLFGMGKSKKWCLLANAGDSSMIRNSLCYALSRRLGTDTTSETVQANLYVNGEYRGLYCITEKVEIDENRIDIYDLEGATEEVNGKAPDEFPPAGAQNSTAAGSIQYANIPENPEDISGGYLLELEKLYRYPPEISGFVTRLRQAVVVKTPEYASKKQVEYISDFYQLFEDALYSENGYNGRGVHYSQYADIASLARMYILDEFASNFDGCSSSFYLWKDSGGVLTAGPAWDFDLSLGCTIRSVLINHDVDPSDPELMYIATCFIGNHNETRYGLLAQCCMHEDFRAEVKKIWLDEVVPYINEFNSNITAYSSAILPGVIMNSIVWNTFGTDSQDAITAAYNSTINYISSFAGRRYTYLSSVFAADSLTVKYDLCGTGKALTDDTAVYKKGDSVTLKAAPEPVDSRLSFAGWADTADGTGKIYQPGDSVTLEGDLKLHPLWKLPDSVFVKLAELFSRITALLKTIANIL